MIARFLKNVFFSTIQLLDKKEKKYLLSCYILVLNRFRMSKNITHNPIWNNCQASKLNCICLSQKP